MTKLHDHIASAAKEPLHSAITALAETLRHQHKGVAAILAYGSAVRNSNPEDTLIDYYVLTESFDGVSENSLSQMLCRHFPPNVYYIEQSVENQSYRAKYAVLPVELLAEKVSPRTSNPYFWARFCQPMHLVFASDEIARKRVLQLLERAASTALSHARRLEPKSDFEAQWISLFRETYQTELRPEDASRANLIVTSQRKHFEAVSRLAEIVEVSDRLWSTRQWQGKLLSIGRLVKAAFTFQGGVDYAAWKIKRHSGVDIQIKDWHRRHPLLASIVLLPKLLRRGGLK
jgi:hypothetical protein